MSMNLVILGLPPRRALFKVKSRTYLRVLTMGFWKKKNNNEWRMCCWLHWSQQALPEGPLCAATHRPSYWLYGRLHTTLLPWLLLGLPSDRPQGRRLDQDCIHHPIWRLCIQNYVFWAEECMSYIPAGHSTLLQEAATSQRRNLRGWCGRKDLKSRWLHQGFGGNLR